MSRTTNRRFKKLTLTKKQQAEFKKKYPELYEYWHTLNFGTLKQLEKLDKKKIESQFNTCLKRSSKNE